MIRITWTFNGVKQEKTFEERWTLLQVQAYLRAKQNNPQVTDLAITVNEIEWLVSEFLGMK